MHLQRKVHFTDGCDSFLNFQFTVTSHSSSVHCYSKLQIRNEKTVIKMNLVHHSNLANDRESGAALLILRFST